jgi:hypothetical protein
MMSAPVPADVARTAQVMLLIATATFVGVRFLPARYRQRVGITLTVCYVTGLVGFAAWVMGGAR